MIKEGDRYSTSPAEHIEQGDTFLKKAEWAGNTPRAASEAFAAAATHFAAATAKLTYAAQQAREAMITFNKNTPVEADEIDAAIERKEQEA